MEEEIWRDIKGYEGLYQVSNLGRVRSLQFVNNRYKVRTPRLKVLKPSYDKYGYLMLGLCKDGKHKNVHPHRLVAEAFIPNPENKPQVNHIDGNKINNCVNNLEWCTHGENQKHAHRIGIKQATKYWTGKFGKEHHNSKPILQYDLNGNFIKRWDSMSDIERELNIRHGRIWYCCTNRQKTSHGFIWRYAEK